MTTEYVPDTMTDKSREVLRVKAIKVKAVRRVYATM